MGGAQSNYYACMPLLFLCTQVKKTNAISEVVLRQKLSLHIKYKYNKFVAKYLN
jgi:hypothetical protein